MDLLLRQLHCTSFAGRGLKQLVSQQVPLEVRKAFSDRIISYYWEPSNPPTLGYRAIYLYQITSEQTLFGWLYADGIDQNGSVIPYFACYYLDETLLSFHLEMILTYLQKGPLTVIDRNNPSTLVETKVISNLWNYEPARPGVVLSSEIRQQCHTALSQEKLITLFIPLSAQETVIFPSEQTYEQQIANLSVYQHYIIEGIVSHDDLISPKTLNEQGKPKFQQSENDIKNIRELQQSSLVKVKENSLAITQNNSSHQKSSREKVLSQDEQLNLNTMPYNHTNIQFLLRIGIIATALAVTISLYRLIQIIILSPIASEVRTNNLVFYKTLAEVPNVPQGVFNYGGSPTLAPLRSPGILSTISQSQKQFQLRFVEPVGTPQGSAAGIKMLLDGELSFTLSSRPLKEDEIALAKARGFALEQIPIAIDGITFFIHPRNPIVGLNLAQLQDIFSGRITNWKSVGGSDLPITAYSFTPQVSGTADVVQQRVLAGREFGKNVQVVGTATEAILKVAANPGAIGYSSASVVVGQKTIYPLPISIASGEMFVTPFVGINETVLNKTAFTNGSYPLTRRLFAIVKRDGKLDEQVGVSYVNLLTTDEGQKLVEQAGFVPIR
ncbi:PstS family phosphate ABC transporter substrate-binding protein [Gloeocapsopsis crepidinum LEGE 06123]|uniref:PstS family phosphate ABC transporter substrate-binding protein n=1 Tax=Gloeocapsopsis crepidinum LEGE 06123 TaxID=588587 RepID=A0ABR9UN49_9CHRO|nr:PstS family phosphate ABC transporter substrate-binding protein [Gloeocapsopsis crepidinum]MBE9189689.1 PstS family phosphate ABC transporter substrate-binding protein [Gloeocapsopsis crepidinum LEGE 06123]